MPKVLLKIAIWAGVILVLLYAQTKFRIFTKLIKNLFVYERVLSYKTPSIIKSVKQIDQLISAEYCGETYCSLQEITEIEIDREWKNREEDLKALFLKIKSELKKLAQEGNSSSKQIRIFRNDKKYSYLTSDPLYKDLVNEIADGKLGEIRDFAWNTFTGKRYDNYKENFRKDRATNSDLIYISRGCIQAGVNLSQIENIRNHKVKVDSIFYIDSIKAIVFPANVNPWFVPDTLAGFEVWETKKAKHLPFDKIDEVKNECIDKMHEEAISFGIKLKAVENAKMTIESVVKALNPEIKRVEFKYPFADYYSEMILIDSVVDTFEVQNLENDIGKSSAGNQATQKSKYDSILKKLEQFCNSTGHCEEIVKQKLREIEQLLESSK